MDIKVKYITDTDHISQDVGTLTISGKHITAFVPDKSNANDINFAQVFPINRLTEYKIKFLHKIEFIKYKNFTITATITQVVHGQDRRELHCGLSNFQTFYLKTIWRKSWWWNDSVIKNIYRPIIIGVILSVVAAILYFINNKLK